MMTDHRQIMRAMLLGLAPKDHRGLSVAELIKIGYSKNSAEAMALAYQEQKGENA